MSTKIVIVIILLLIIISFITIGIVLYIKYRQQPPTQEETKTEEETSLINLIYQEEATTIPKCEIPECETVVGNPYTIIWGETPTRHASYSVNTTTLPSGAPDNDAKILNEGIAEYISDGSIFQLQITALNLNLGYSSSR